MRGEVPHLNILLKPEFGLPLIGLAVLAALTIVCAAPLVGTGAPPAAPPGMIYIPGGDSQPLQTRGANPRKHRLTL